MHEHLTAKEKTGPVAKQIPVSQASQTQSDSLFRECATDARGVEVLRARLARCGVSLYGDAVSGLAVGGCSVPDLRGAWILLRRLEGLHA